MTNTIDDAIARLQHISMSLSSVQIKTAPEEPIETEAPFPLSVAFVASGDFYAVNYTVLHEFPVINVEFHFSRTNLKLCYQQNNAVIYEFPRRLAGDPTLDGTVETIVMSDDSRLPFVSRPFTWREKTATAPALVTQALIFSVPIKLRPSPLTTP